MPETELTKRGIELAIDFMMAVVGQRIKDDGVAWWAQDESVEIMHKYSISMFDMKVVYRKVEEVAGEEIHVFSNRPTGQRVSWLMKRLKETGTITDEQKAECEKLFPDQDRVGMAIKSAKVRLGMDRSRVQGDPDDDEPIRPTPPGYMEDVSILLHRYQKLLDEKFEKEEQLHKINVEIEKYKPLVRVMEAARDAVKNIKENGS